MNLDSDWNDEDERALRSFRRAYEGEGLTPWRSMRRWKRAAWIFAILAAAETVAIWAILTGKWMAC